ncbi:oxysterol-binding protein-related protein 9 isoform X2 [Lingula anatina]|uniref:Oxysterol-binding protein n=1 Tax=Lingula anatina TaxID=7574 RepID=A0A1S3J406_LINAN|nr:oxysterol-binding protein-related protein 9 isoform X2 [Lingula anatina]|eukprot:XP_013405003.1 oxysterol-binding protein-related protein 9 isoform X2 [Lingula anatina]
MATIEGPLSKWTNVMKGWQYRWFVLDENTGLLSYYTSKEKMMRGSRRGCVRLKGAIIGIDDEDDSTFTITVDQKTFHFQARDAEERERWIGGLEEAILRHTQPLSKQRESKHIPSTAEFDSKVAETDAYLQLLIDQTKALDEKIEQCDDPAAREKYSVIKVAAETMIESIKQSIVLLQMSKQQIADQAMVENGPLTPPLQAAAGSIEHSLSFSKFFHSSASKLGSSLSTSPAASTTELPPIGPMPNSMATSNGIDVPPHNTTTSHSLPASSGGLEENGISPAVDALLEEEGGDMEQDGSVGAQSHMMSAYSNSDMHVPPRVMPMTSYSSSEDEEFYDAEELERSATEDEPPKAEPVQVIASKDDYFDELYDEVDQEDLGSLEGQGSIVTHLLSQVRIGMDLTKIVLPTFILERRSLLEMFADFFAHPDLFVGIVDFKDPKERMIQVVRWYLSAFHAGRRSDIAKKPYNPIIGETFQCFWDIPNMEPSDEVSDSGPVPWVHKNNLAFIAEQVSHHPPISAFYAEHSGKRISLDGYIWTKSKFLGLSIGVYMIGQAVISVLDHDEEYVLTFPTGYGRSILTVPWIELGGKVGVQCAKTGYYANIEFKTKPFYGGKKHQVAAAIFAPNDKKPICTIDGEWNGVMWAQYNTGRSEKFVDTKSMPIIKKKVKPRTEQGEFESRRLWQDVTKHLKEKNVDKATEFKRKLEQRQREEAKERLEKGLKWETKHFHEQGEHWLHHRPLLKRLQETVTRKSRQNSPEGDSEYDSAS